jgi:hypothetical protein
LWIGIAVVTAIHTLVSPNTHTVFPLFAASATHWWADQPLYSSYRALDLFRYPPTFAIAITPFAVLGPKFGGIMWSWTGMTVFAVGLLRFARVVLPERWCKSRTANFLALAALIALPGMWNAQSNTLAVGLLLLATSSVAQKNWWAAAILLASAVLTKLTPIVPALLLCALQPVRLAPRFTLAMALGMLLPFLTRPPEIVMGHYLEWIAHLVSTGGTRWAGYRDGWTLWVIITSFLQGTTSQECIFGSVDSLGYRVLQLTSAFGTLAWCKWQQKQGGGARWHLCSTFGMAMAWLMLFGPSAEHATYAFLAPCLSWAVLHRNATPRGRCLSVLAFVLIAVLGWDYHWRLIIGPVSVLAAALPLGSVIYTVWLIDYAQSRRRKNQPGQAAPDGILVTAHGIKRQIGRNCPETRALTATLG